MRLARALAVVVLTWGCQADEAPAEPAELPEVPDLGLIQDVVEVHDVPEAGDDVAPPDDETAPDVPEDVPEPPPQGLLDTAAIGPALCVAGIGWFPSEETVPWLQELGVGRVRIQLYWHQVEPSPGEWKLDRLDQKVDPYVSAGVDVIGVLGYGNPWATAVEDADRYYPPDDPADFAAYVTATVTHLQGRLERYEVWNEPNAGYRFWKPELKGDPVAYGALLKAAVSAGRDGCPTCRFAFGGPFFHSQFIDGHVPFLAAAQAAHPDLAEHWDAMGFHPYPLYPPTAAPEGPPPAGEMSFQDMVAGVREVMAEQGASDRPLWATEMGWPIFGDVDQDLQAAYLVRGVLHMLALGAETVCWYNIADGPDPGEFPPEDAFGLLTSDDPRARKPAFHALAQLGNRFAEHRLTRDLAAAGVIPEGLHGYALEGPAGDTWWAVWTGPEVPPTPLDLPGVTEIRTATGELVTGPLEAGPLPRFVRLQP